MSTSQRICETCVYCSFAGNCDRYNKPLTSIEQPACDAYEIHPLLAENDRLRELVARLIRHIENPPCESCMAEMSCAGGEGLTNCDEYQFMVCDARELGVNFDQ